jgi:hypothetical protein
LPQRKEKAAELTWRLRPFGVSAICKGRRPRAGSGTPQEPSACVAVYSFMKPTPTISEKKASIAIWIGAAVFTIGAMFFGH